MPALSKLPCGNGGGSGGDADFQLGDTIYDMPITAYSACANYYKNELYLCSYSRYTNGRCYKYDGSTWTELSSPPNNYYDDNLSLASCVFNNRIYYISANSSIYSYDGNSYTYVSINNPYDIALGNYVNHGSVVVNNKLYLAFGSRLIYIDSDNNVFGAGSIPTGGDGGDNIPVFNSGSILVADDNNIYGIVNHADASFCKWVTYNPNTDSWSSLNMIANYFSSNFCAFTYNNIAYHGICNYYTDTGSGNSYNTYAIYKRNLII